MDLVNIIYRYVNRFINSEELIELLKNLDKKKFLQEERKEIEKLIRGVEETINKAEIKIDQFEINRLSSLNHILKDLEKIKASSQNDEKTRQFFEKQYNNLLKDKEKARDSGPRYEKLFELLTNNSVYKKYCLKMNDLELLEFITQYISVPLPPKLKQKDFDDLVVAGIKKDKREAIWRLAMNYNHKEKGFSKIVDYFIEKRDNYYLAELISGVEKDLDLDAIIDKALKTDDVEFIRKMANTSYIQPIFTEEQKDKVKNRIQK